MARTQTPAEIAAAAQIVARYEAQGGKAGIVVNHWTPRNPGTENETWVSVR